MGKSGEGRGLFRRRSTPPEQDPTIDLTSVLSSYGRSAVLAPPEPPPAVPLDDDSVRYAAVETLDQPVVDLTDDARAAAPAPVETPVEAQPPAEVVEVVEVAAEPWQEDGTPVEHQPAAEALEVVEVAEIVEAVEPVEAVEEPPAAEVAEPWQQIETPVADQPAGEVAGMVEAVASVEVVEPLLVAETPTEPWQEIPTPVEDQPAAEEPAGITGAVEPVDGVEEPAVAAEHAWDAPAWSDPAPTDAPEAVAAAAAYEVVEAPEAVEAPVETPRHDPAVPPSAGWWEDGESAWDTATLEAIDAVVHEHGLPVEADLAPEQVAPEEAFGHHDEHRADDAGPLEVAAWATVLESTSDAVDEHAADLVDVAPPAASDAPAAAAAPWWQALRTDDLGGVPALATEQHDEQHHAHGPDDEQVDVPARLAVVETAADDRPWWAALQSPEHDVRSEEPVVDLREESLSDDPEAVAARLARLRDAGLLSHEEYAAETRALLADRG